MTKADIVSDISNKTGIEKFTVQQTVEAFMETVTVKEFMISNQNVYLRGFGSFIVKKRAQKKARDITKNKEIIVPEHYIPDFKPSDKFLEGVKNNVK